MAKLKSSKKSKFSTIITARFTEPDKKDSVRMELDIKHGRYEDSQNIERFVGNLRKVKKHKSTKK